MRRSRTPTLEPETRLPFDPEHTSVLSSAWTYAAPLVLAASGIVVALATDAPWAILPAALGCLLVGALAWDARRVSEGQDRELSVRRERAVRAIQALDVGLLIMDERARIEFASPVCGTLFECEPYELQGCALGELLDASVAQRWDQFLASCQGDREATSSARMTFELRRDEAPSVPIEMIARRLEAGTRVQFLVMLRDQSRERRVTELESRADELHEANAALSRAMAQLQQTTAAKSEFLANMSHEIRTPLTAILGFTEILMEDGDLRRAPDDRLVALETIQRNSSHLVRLINDILDLSKIESGRLRVEEVHYSPAAIVADVVQLMQVRADAKGIALETQYLTPIPARVIGDPTRVRQILINLIGNAIKFTEVGSVRLAVALELGTGAPRLILEVVDTGIGIAPVELSRLFRPFEQADTSTTRKHGGTGLGLVICRRLCDLMGGSLDVRSQPGQGSTFRVSLPVGAVDPEELAECPATPERELEVAPQLEYPSFSGHVLLAEDGPDNQRLIRSLLHKTGVEVTIAENGRVAVERVRAATDAAQPFDLILMDVQMPEMDGYTATRELRIAGCRTPVIALTAHAMAGERERCIDAGCDEFATKPIDRHDLFEKMRRLLQEAKSAG